MKKFSNARVGDEVWVVGYGLSTIKKIVPESEYPIQIKGEEYTLDGFEYQAQTEPVVFYANGYQPPTDAGEPKRLPDYKKGQVVFVKVNNNMWPIFFDKFNIDGGVVGISSSSVYAEYTDVNPYLEK